MDIQISNELFNYSVDIRRQLHMYPELGFELEKTVKLVSEELNKIGIPYTYEYGKSSIVAHLGQGDKMIALRADMDALPVEEKTDLPYKSKIKGKMHACGHDSHTAILLAVAKYLKENEDKLNCMVRLVFQPSEEGPVSGGKMMVENGVCDGVESIVCTHCNNGTDAGEIGICSGDHTAACVSVTKRFNGRTSHASFPEHGIDAVAMSVEAYRKLKDMVAKEAGDDNYIWSVGRFQGGHTHNVIADLCEMDISFRYYNNDFAKRVEKKVRNICEKTAANNGGSVDIVWNLAAGVVHNDEKLVEKFEKAARNSGLNVQYMPKRMTGEDFGWYLEKIPGMLFRFGTRNENLGCTAPVHRNDFCIDETGMKPAIQAFCAYVMSYD